MFGRRAETERKRDLEDRVRFTLLTVCTVYIGQTSKQDSGIKQTEAVILLLLKASMESCELSAHKSR